MVSSRASSLIRGNVAGEVSRLKQQPGKDLAVLGSATLASYLRNEGLVDEYHLTVVPIALCAGRPLFSELRHSLNLELLQAKTLRSGNVQLFYRMVRNAGG